MNAGVAERLVPHLHRVAERPVRVRLESSGPSVARRVRLASFTAAVGVAREQVEERLHPVGVETASSAATARGSARAFRRSASTPDAKKFASGSLDVPQLFHVGDEPRPLHREHEIVRRLLVPRLRNSTGRWRE